MTEVLVIDQGTQGGRSSYTENLVSRLRENGWNVTTVRTTPDADIQIPLFTGSDFEFLIRITLMGILGRLPDTDLVNTQRTVELLPFWLRRSNAALFATCHGKDTQEMEIHRSSWIVALYNVVESFSLQAADKVITVDESTKEYLRQKHDLPDELFAVIPVGADETVFRPINKKELPRDYQYEGDVLLFAGRFSQVKNLPLLVETFEKLRMRRQCYLIAAGDGEEYDSFEKCLETRGLREFTDLPGYVDHHKLSRLMNIADCLILTSDHEGSPNVVREALACGLPVVSTDVGDVSQVVTRPSRGCVVRERSADVMAKQVEQVLDSGSNSCCNDRSDVLFQQTYERVVYLYTKYT